MVQAIKILANSINNLHDTLIKLAASLGYNLNDKQLHFIIIGAVGIIIYFVSDALFRMLAKLSVSIISFIYTFTVLVVLVFALEIEQKITGRGRMEFSDIVAGLWGFLEIFGIYLLIRLIIYAVKSLIRWAKGKARKNI